MQSANNGGSGAANKPPRGHVRSYNHPYNEQSNPEDEYEHANEEGNYQRSNNHIIDKHETGSASGAVPAVAGGDDPDERSIFVKNVHFSATAEDLKQHFSDCGEILRVTIPVDKMTNKPKGYAFYFNLNLCVQLRLH